MKVLVLAPHTDDGELGCGGTIARFVEEGRINVSRVACDFCLGAGSYRGRAVHSLLLSLS